MPETAFAHTLVMNEYSLVANAPPAQEFMLYVLNEATLEEFMPETVMLTLSILSFPNQHRMVAIVPPAVDV